jgi:hypothetical protein
MAEEEVLALTNSLSGAAGGQLFSQRLHAATEGNPFFLLETLRFLFERGLLVAGADGWSTPFDAVTSDYAELPVPPSVRTVVLGRVRSLGEPVRRLLELASLHSGGIDPRLLGDPGAADEQAVVTALERAEDAQLIVDAGEPADQQVEAGGEQEVQVAPLGHVAARLRRIREPFPVEHDDLVGVLGQRPRGQQPRDAGPDDEHGRHPAIVTDPARSRIGARRGPPVQQVERGAPLEALGSARRKYTVIDPRPGR